MLGAAEDGHSFAELTWAVTSWAERLAEAQATAKASTDVPIDVDSAREASIATLKREVKAEMERLYLRNGQVYTVTNTPR